MNNMYDIGKEYKLSIFTSQIDGPSTSFTFAYLCRRFWPKTVIPAIQSLEHVCVHPCTAITQKAFSPAISCH